MSRFKIALAISTMLVLLLSSTATASAAGNLRESMVTNGDLDNGCCNKP